MPNVILSFCVPTYDRPERILSILEQVSSFPSKEIEIVISDDNPSSNKTQEVIKKFKDPRIKYFRNKKNLGYDGNILISIKRAIGEFVFILIDEDELEIESIPWILEKIKKNKNLTQLRGTIGDKRPGHNKPYYKLEDKLLPRGFNSMFIPLFYYSVHGTAIILMKSVLDLNKAKKYIGFLFIQQILVVQALIAGETLCSSKIFAHLGKKTYESQQPPIKRRKWWHPVSVLYVIKIRLEIIYEITKGMKEKKKVRKEFKEKEIDKIYFYLIETLFYDSFKVFKSVKSFIEGLAYIITIKMISKSPKFWIKLFLKLFRKFKLTLISL